MSDKELEKSMSLDKDTLRVAYRRKVTGNLSWKWGTFENWGRPDEVICVLAMYSPDEGYTELEFRYTS